MTTLIKLVRAAGTVAFAAALGACSTAPPIPPAPTMTELLSQASAAAASGQKEQAVTIWKKAATAFPADKAPWGSIAQTRYEAGQYGEAIIAAQEVLLRDPSDKLANSIIAISGLRLSTRALGDLSRQNNLSGSLRTESQDLAKLLRESLGETVLVPPAAAPRPRPAAPRAQPRVERTSKADKDDDSSANPFNSLK